MLAIWFGLLTGLAEVVILAVRKLILHQMVDQGDQVVRMAPLACFAQSQVRKRASYLAPAWRFSMCYTW